MQCAEVTSHPITGVTNTQIPEFIPEEDTGSSSGASTMSDDLHPDGCSDKVTTDTVTSSSSLPTQSSSSQEYQQFSQQIQKISQYPI